MEINWIRHTAVDVPAGYCYGQTDVPLRKTFETEATRVKAGLQGIKPDGVYTSPLSRCTKLAAFCGYPDAVTDDRLKELNFGKWEMKPFSDFTGEQAEQWFADWIGTPAPEGESLTDQYSRVAAFLDELRRKELEKVFIFTHGGVITCARVYAGEYDMREAFRHIPGYGEIVPMKL